MDLEKGFFAKVIGKLFHLIGLISQTYSKITLQWHLDLTTMYIMSWGKYYWKYHVNYYN